MSEPELFEYIKCKICKNLACTCNECIDRSDVTVSDQRATNVTELFGWLRERLAGEKRDNSRDLGKLDLNTIRRVFGKLDHMIDLMEEFHLARFSNPSEEHVERFSTRCERAFHSARQLLFLREEWRHDENPSFLDCLRGDHIEFSGRKYPSIARCILDMATDHETPLFETLRICKISISKNRTRSTFHVLREDRFEGLCQKMNAMEWMSFEHKVIPELVKSPNESDGNSNPDWDDGEHPLKRESTTIDEARLLLLGLSEEDQSVKSLSLEKTASRVTENNQKRCSIHAIRKARELLGWPPNIRSGAKTKRSRTTSGDHINDVRSQKSSQEVENVTEEEAIRKIRALPLNEDSRDKILAELRDDRTTPTTALNCARQLVEESHEYNPSVRAQSQICLD